MLELPEVLTLAGQLKQEAAGKSVAYVLPPAKPHKFCWFSGDPADYEPALKGRRVITAEGFGIFVELSFEGGGKLCFNDGVNVRLCPQEKVPGNYQLVIGLDNGMALAFTVAMYGSILLHNGDLENEYYQKSREGISPFTEDFPGYFWDRAKESSPGLSAKAFLATEQRFPGIGNGTLQDILFAAGIHPKRKMGTMSQEELGHLLECTKDILREMTAQGGRDTEKDLFGRPGGYRTEMSKNTWKSPCPVCMGPLTKETYLGGSVYYCPCCQPLRLDG